MRFLPVFALTALLCAPTAEAAVRLNCVGVEVGVGPYRPTTVLCPPSTPG